MRRRWRPVLVVGLMAAICAAGGSPTRDDDYGERLFALDVKPLLAAKCFACHGQDPGVLLGGLDLTSREAVLREGQSGRTAVVPDSAVESPLFLAVSGGLQDLATPPKQSDGLGPEQVASIWDWIDSGAPWPADGAWVTYGLGSLNQNLPGYAVMTELAHPQGGAGNWSNGFLAAHYQSTLLRPSGSPLLDLSPPEWKTREQQRQSLDMLAEMNRRRAELHPSHEELRTRMESYELAYRMQAEAPDLVDLSGESEATKEAYGLDQGPTRAFGRQCLLARRLVEQGVRFVQIFSGGWDSHDFLERNHAARIQSIAKPAAALPGDLRQRGMLDETLVVCSGEFARTPDNNRCGGVDANCRGHNADAMVVLMAGGGTPAGTVVGATDEVGNQAVEIVHPLRDSHVTWLRPMGPDDNRLTYFHGGRFKRLSQVGGGLIPGLIA